MQEGEESVVAICVVADVLLQGNLPGDVFLGLGTEAIGLQSGKELIHAETRVGGDVRDDELGSGVDAGGSDDARDVVDGDHVDGVEDVGVFAELNGALEHAHEEVVGVGRAGGGVADDVAGTDNVATETTVSGFTDEVLSGPLGLAVAVPETGGGALQVVGFGDTGAAGAEDGVGELDVVVGVDDGGGGDEDVGLGDALGAEVEGCDCAEDVGGAEGLVRVDPVDEGTIVDNDVHLLGQPVPSLLGQAEPLLAKLTSDGLKARQPSRVPNTVSLARSLKTT